MSSLRLAVRASESAPAPATEPQRRARIGALALEGRLTEAVAMVAAEGGGTPAWLTEAIIAALEARDLSLAGGLGAVLTWLERGVAGPGLPSPPPPQARLSATKLRHDIAQLRWLREQGGMRASEVEAIRAAYQTALDGLDCGDPEARLAFPARPDPVLAAAYGRLVNLKPAPRLARALSGAWSPALAEAVYRRASPSLVVVDDFLSQQALESLLAFCRASTIWHGDRYTNGRMSSLFFTGFNCPLLLQIAEEVREAFPELIGDRHPLRQLWAFKTTGFLPPDSTIHADFAAVNVNFWLTPEAANLDPTSGGMVVYDLEAPLAWGFAQYNERPDLIGDLIARCRPRAVRIPYRQNRAIIFNSDLFHATEAVCFSPDYAGCRINVTLLYGDRRFDENHREPPLSPEHKAAWRSAALGRGRRG
ncbi:hypothetical protein [Caulobacter sp. LARHSG274]